jgi:hypothetical protein
LVLGLPVFLVCFSPSGRTKLALPGKLRGQDLKNPVFLGFFSGLSGWPLGPLINLDIRGKMTTDLYEN